MNIGFFLLVARYVLIAVLAVAGVAKLLDLRGSRKSLVDFGVPLFLVPILGILLPLLELACAIALVFDRWSVSGAVGATALFTVFTAGITLSLARGRAPDCHCFGQLSSSPITWRTLVRNLILLALAVLVAWKGDQFLFTWADVSISFEAAVIASIATIAMLIALTWFFLLNIVRQNGQLLLRLDSIEKHVSIDPNIKPVLALPIGDPAPPFELNDLEGRTQTLNVFTQSGKPVLLVFTEPGCAACRELMPDLASSQRERMDDMVIVPISSGALDLNRQQSASLGLRNVLLQAGGEVREAYHVTTTPSAVLVIEGKVASRIETGPDAIRSLMIRTTLPQLQRGEVLPSLRLQDLGGKSADVGMLRGRRRLLLFWSPFCGFCQKMLPEIKPLKRIKNGAELLVISSGPLDANQRQALSATVLLDPYFACHHVLGATETPSAVLIDERGRVASEVAVGLPAVANLVGFKVPGV